MRFFDFVILTWLIIITLYFLNIEFKLMIDNLLLKN